MISQTQHLQDITKVKGFFKNHIKKIQGLVSKKQNKITSLTDFILSLQHNLQKISIDLENTKCELAEKSSKFSSMQQEIQQLKLDKLVYVDDTSNFQREIGAYLLSFQSLKTSNNNTKNSLKTKTEYYRSKMNF